MASASTSSPLRSDLSEKLMLRTGRWHECQCCNYQDHPATCSSSKHVSEVMMSKHTHLQPVGSPFLRCCSTKPSWPQTNLLASLRNLHCNHMAWKTSHSHRLDSDNPCHGLCSTTPFWALTNLLASWRNHQRSCMDRPVARRAAELA